MAVPYALLFWAEQYVTSSMSAVLYSASPLAVSLITPAMMHRKVPRRAVYAMVMAFGGILVLFYENPSTNRMVIIGGSAVLVSMLLTSWSIVYAKQRLHDVDSVVATGIQSLLGSVVLLWATWALEAHRHAVWTRTAMIGAGVPDHPWISHRFCYLLLAVEEASALSDFHHQPDYSSGGHSCGVAGWRTHSFADAACGGGGAGFGMVSIAGGRTNGAGRR